MRSFLLCLTLCLCGMTAWAAQDLKDVQANAYFRVRDQRAPVTRFDPKTVADSPASFAGKLLEVRGMVRSVSDRDELTTIQVALAGSAGEVSIRFPLDEHLLDWPCIELQEEIRALCRVIKDESGAGTLELVIAVNNREAAIVDQLRNLSQNSKRTSAGRRLITQDQYASIYAAAIRNFNRGVSYQEAHQIASNIILQSRRNGLDARLVMAVIATESRFNADARSHAGAQGLGQLMPGTARELGVLDPFDMQQNLRGSVSLLRRHMQQMSRKGRLDLNTIKLALACYNAGPGAVRKYGGVPPYRETQDYVKKITRLYWSMLQPHERADLAKQGWKVN